MDKALSPSTHAEHQEVASDMLVATKNLEPFTFKIIGEGIYNKTKDLENIKCTLGWLHFLGLSFHLGNFADRGRYESLVCPFSIFFDLITTKLSELDFTEIIDTLVANKDKVIQYLKQNSWTEADLTSHWQTD